MKWVFAYLKPLRARITVGTLVKIIGTVAELMIPFLLTHILENVIATNNVGKILFYGALMAICAVIACLGNIIANRMAAKTTMKFSTEMRRDLFSKQWDSAARKYSACQTDGNADGLPTWKSRGTCFLWRLE